MRKYYRLIDTASEVNDNVPILLNLGGVHYSTFHSSESTYRNFVILLDDEELLVAKLSLNSVSISPLDDQTYNYLKQSGYIR